MSRGAPSGGGLRRAWRLPMLGVGFAALLAGLGAGLVRLGWTLPPPFPGLAPVHGPLMVSGFFGTVIGLERAVALARHWAYLAPAATALGTVVLLGGAPFTGALLILAGSAVLALSGVAVLRRQPAVFTAALAAGAASWLVGNLAWVGGRPFTEVVPWWIGFLALTIAGERLELSRFHPTTAVARHGFAVIVLALAITMLATAAAPRTGGMAFAASLLALSLWLARHDIARRTVRQRGLPRYIASCLLLGYLWLAVAGLIGLGAGGLLAPEAYDAVLHAVFLGFVFSMVFGHAPIILPAVTGLAVPYRPVFYLHLLVLHLSLGLRVLGDLAGVEALRQAGGGLNGLALVLFLADTAAALALGRARAPAARR